MARNAVQSATAIPLSPLDSRKARMRKYSIAMSMRMVCLVLVFALPGWWKVVFAVGAIVFPWVAVVIANVGARGSSTAIAPGLPLPQVEQPALAPATRAPQE